jgi:Ca2+-transporting ATPase
MEKGDPDVMEKPPRKTDEPIINDTMRLGVVIQIIAGSLAVLAAYFLGLYWQLGDAIPDGVNTFQYLLQYDWRSVGVQTAQTMAFVTLTLCQLFRAYTVRSEKESLFKIGVFSNRSMQLAFGASIVLLLLVVNVPLLRPVFNTSFLTLTQWAVATGLALIPATIEEMTKAFIRSRDHTHKPELAVEQTMKA